MSASQIASTASRFSSQISRLSSNGRRKAWYSVGDAPLPGAELDPPAREDVERGDALGDAHGMLERQQHHTVTEADARRDARQRRQHRLGCGAVGEAAREVVLDEPHRPVADLVREHTLLDDMLEGLAFDVGRTPAHLELVRHPDLQPFISLVRARRYPVVLKWRYGGATLRKGDPCSSACSCSRRTRPSVSIDDGIEQDLRIIEWSTSSGYSEVWVGEHLTAPWEPYPACDLIMAQAHAAHRSTSCCASGAYMLPFYHPAELALRIAQLDHMAQGRFICGVAAGFSQPTSRCSASTSMAGDEPRHDARVARDHAASVGPSTTARMDLRTASSGP